MKKNEKESREQFIIRSLDRVENAISIFDKEAFLIYANESFCKNMNIPDRDAAIGMHIHNITKQAGIRIHATKTGSDNLKMMEVLRKGKKFLDWEVNIEAENSPNNARLVSNSMYPIKNPDGSIQGMIEISSSQQLNLSHTKHLIGLNAEYTFDSILGESTAITEAKREAEEYAASPYNLLIVGESGVGKELFAQAVHNESSRRNGPFVAINCASLPENLIESELFGYVSGAFTGASRNGQIGKFELADGGTLFLDEIGELPVQFQSKLLRAIETRTITRIGSTSPTRVNVRIIAATNRDLKKMISEGFFREDLYYRLQVLNVVIPPLRERSRDMILIANAFLAQAAEYADGEAKPLSPEAETVLAAYPWPGNIRELKNVIYRVSLLAKGESISREDIEAALYSKSYRLKQENSTPLPAAPVPAKPEAKKTAALTPEERLEMRRREVDASYANLIEEALSITDGNKKQAADLLGVSRKTIYRMMEKYCTT